jgi:PAS domain S-box-containing protein
MFSQVQTFYSRMSMLGVGPHLAPHIAGRIRFANIAALFLLHFIPMWMGAGNFSPISVIVFSLCGLGYASVLWLNTQHYYNVSRYVLILVMTSVSVISVSMAVKPAPQYMIQGVQQLLLGFFLVPLIVFHQSERRGLFFSLVIFLVAILGLKPIDEAIQWIDLAELQTDSLQWLSVFVFPLFAICLIFFLVFNGLRIDAEIIERFLIEEKKVNAELKQSAEAVERKVREAEEVHRQLSIAQQQVETARQEAEEKARMHENANTKLMLALREMNKRQENLQIRQFIDTGLARLTEKSQWSGKESLETWASNLCQFIAEYTGSLRVGLYSLPLHATPVQAGLEYVCWGGAGLETIEVNNQLLGHKMGWLQRVVEMKWPYFENKLAPGQLKASVGLGTFDYKAVAIIPLLNNQQVEGILELAFAQPFDLKVQQFLEDVARYLGNHLVVIKSQQQIARLLEETRERAEALAAQDEEMRQYTQELEAVNAQNRQIQQALAQNQATLQAVLNSSKDRIYAIDREHRLVIFNETVAQIIRDKFKKEVKIGDNIFDYVYDAAKAERKASYERAFAGEQYTSEQIVRNPDGDRYVITTYTPIRNAFGEVVNISVFGTDITEHRQISESIRLSEQKLKIQFESIPLAMVEWSMDMKVVSWNPAAEKIFGYSAAEARGRHILDLVIAPEDHEDAKGYINRFQKKALQRVFKNRTKNGNTCYCEWYNTPLNDVEGNQTGLLTIIQDITEQRAAAEALRRNEAMLQQVQRQAKLGSFQYIQATDTLHWSEEMYRHFGMSPEGQPTLSLQTLIERIHIKERNDLEQHLTQCLVEGLAFVHDYRAVRLDGRAIYLQLQVEPILNRQQEVTGFLGAALDITKLKLAEQTLIQKNRQMQQQEEKLRTQLDELNQVLQENERIQLELRSSQQQLQTLNDNLEQTIEARNAELRAALVGIQTSEHRLQNILHRLPVGIHLCSPEGVILEANEMAEVIWGKTMSELRAEGANLLTDPQFRTMGLESEIRRAFQGVEVHLPVSEYVTGNLTDSAGLSFKWIRGSLFPVKDIQGNLTTIVATYQDVTELKEAEIQLKNISAIQEATLKGANVAIISMDLDHRVLLYNQAAEHIFGYRASQVVGQMPFEQFLEPLGLEEKFTVLKDQFAQGKLTGLVNERPQEVEWQFVRESGEIFPGRLSITGVRNASHEHIGYIAVLSDITEEKQAAEALTESERRFRRIIDQFPAALQVFAPDGKLITVNRQFKTTWGGVRTDHTLFESGFLRLEPYQKEIRRVLDGFSVDIPPIDYSETLPTGEVRNLWMTSSFFPVFNQDGSVHQVVLVQTDVTQQRLAELEAQRANDELRASFAELESLRQQMLHAERMATLGQLFAGIAHEINTPVSAIAGSTATVRSGFEHFCEAYPGLLQEAGTLQPELQALLRRLLTYQPEEPLTERDKRRLKRTLSETLENLGLADADVYAPYFIDLGFLPTNLDTLAPLIEQLGIEPLAVFLKHVHTVQAQVNNIDEAVQRVGKLMKALKKYSRGQVDDEYAVPTDLIETLNTTLTLYSYKFKEKDIELVTNYDNLPLTLAWPDELGQVWTNLISNSIQAMDRGGTIQIDATEDPATQTAVLRFKDTGSGIPADKLPRIFDPFFTTKKRGEGTGLGLHLCRKIIEKHNGRIEVQSEPGQTVFTISLPIQPVTSEITG